ncbi:MAG: IS21-like element helper ATPase IstB [Desulfobacterales bacterium]|nr:IS21-like element helper ATPase IstB [Desulfobacterales bacterium]
MLEKNLEQMNLMKFYGMATTYQAAIQGKQSFTNDELVSMLIQAEWEDRESRKIRRHLNAARFRYHAAIEEITYSPDRNLDKTMMTRLTDCSFIKRNENILICGPTGVGKSFISSALGNQACHQGFKVLYFNTQKLFTRLRMSKADGSYMREVNRIEKMDLLILDDFGLQQMDDQNRMAFLEIIEDRHGLKSTIISSQLPVSLWHDVIGEGSVADAILDRLVNGAHRMDLMGDSLRKIK